MAYVTFAIVGIFLCLNMPRMLVGGYEVSDTWLILHCVDSDFEYMPSLTFYRWDTVSRLLMVVNSAINFLIYCTGNKQFKVCEILSIAQRSEILLLSLPHLASSFPEFLAYRSSSMSLPHELLSYLSICLVHLVHLVQLIGQIADYLLLWTLITFKFSNSLKSLDNFETL